MVQGAFSQHDGDLGWVVAGQQFLPRHGDGDQSAGLAGRDRFQVPVAGGDVRACACICSRAGTVSAAQMLMLAAACSRPTTSCRWTGMSLA